MFSVFHRGIDSRRGVIMKRSLTIVGITTLVAFGLMVASALSSEVWNRNNYKTNAEIKARVLEKYDYNRNGALDPEELNALKEDNEAIIKGAKERVLELLERYDFNKNGRLDPEEREMFLAN